VAQGDGKGVGHVRGLGCGPKGQGELDCPLYLGFAGMPTPGDGFLYLGGPVASDGDPKEPRQTKNDPSYVTHLDGCPGVDFMGIKGLYGDDRGFEIRKNFFKTPIDLDEPRLQGLSRFALDDPRLNALCLRIPPEGPRPH
jgi:hypothetical protein